MTCNAKRAPSLWLKYDYKEPGDILVQDVFVPAPGLAKCTYYCCLNWNSGREGGGYCGIQDHPDGRAFIFSIWDPQQVKDIPITSVSKDAGTWTDRFGGEGTGLKSMNFELGWKEDQWYTMLVRRWDAPAGGATRFGCWVHDHTLDKWTHLITMEYPVPQVHFVGTTVSFLEDWGFTSENYRCVRYKGGFKRRLDRSWLPFHKADFQVNMNDVRDGTATLNFNAQCQNPEEGVCIAAGANVESDTDTCCTFSDQACHPHPKKQPLDLIKVDLLGERLTWTFAEPGAPLFGFKVTVGNDAIGCQTGESCDGINVEKSSLETKSEDTLVCVELEDILGNVVCQNYTLASLKVKGAGTELGCDTKV